MVHNKAPGLERDKNKNNTKLTQISFWWILNNTKEMNKILNEYCMKYKN
jgi:hypothetical protein